MRYLFISILGGMLLILAACEAEQENEPTLPTQPDDGIRSISYGVEFLFADSAKLNAKLKAARVEEKEEGEKKKETILYLYDGVEIDFYDYRGRPESQATSEQGVYRKDKGLAELNGNVILLNSKGEKLETEQLFWDEKKDQVYTNKFVRVQTEGRIITGDSGLVSNTSFTEYEFRHVSGDFEYQEEKY